MSLPGLGSSSKSTATQQTASDEAVIVGNKGSFLESGSVNVSGKGGKFIAPNSIDLAGATVRENYGLDIGSAGRDITINSGLDGAYFDEQLKQQQGFFSGVLGKLGEVITSQVEKVGQGDSTNLTGVPQPTNWKPIIGLGLAAVAGFALYKLFSK